MNQKQLAAALGLSAPVVCRDAKRGMPTDDVEAARAWRAANVGAYARSTPAQPPAPGGAVPADGAAVPAAAGPRLDLAQERAALAKAQREVVEQRLALIRGESARVDLLARCLATASAAVASRLDQLPRRLRTACPDLPTEAVDEITAVIADARCQWVKETASLVAADLQAMDDDDEP